MSLEVGKDDQQRNPHMCWTAAETSTREDILLMRSHYSASHPSGTEIVRKSVRGLHLRRDIHLPWKWRRTPTEKHNRQKCKAKAIDTRPPEF